MRKLLKKYGFVPDNLVADDLRSYAAAAGHLGIAKRHERGQWRNNRAENSHQPTRRRERKMQGFKRSGFSQKFLSTHAAAYNTFNVQRHLTSARTHRAFRATAMRTWHGRLQQLAENLAAGRPFSSIISDVPVRRELNLGRRSVPRLPAARSVRHLRHVLRFNFRQGQPIAHH
jgi:DDE domain